MDFYINEMTLADIGGVAELEKECFSEPWSENAIKEALDFGTAFFVAKTEEKVIGYVGVKGVLDEGYISNVAVTLGARKLGVGSALIKRVNDWAKENKISSVSLEVRVTNDAAISLYKKHGYKEVGRRKNFYRSPPEDAFILTYEV